MKAPLIEGHDYYLEDGKMVLTEGYHYRRGHCCNSRCRHCPYGNAPGASDASAPSGGRTSSVKLRMENAPAEQGASPDERDAPIVIIGFDGPIKLPR
ncbi:MAG: hypothetical protein HOW73_09365 [Polyangiaceae bacterium]|nr:hypothetical protein [Polyangiaceae bacterium]